MALVGLLALIAALPAATPSAPARFPFGASVHADGPASPLQPRLVLPGIVNSAAETVRVWPQNVGTTRSTITIAYFNQDGTLVPGGVETMTTLPGAHANFPTNTALPAVPFRGLAVIYSDGPVAAVVRHWPPNNSKPGAIAISSTYPFSNDRGSTTTLPYVANALAGTYNTLLTIANTGTETACVQVAYSFVPGIGGVDASGRPVLNDAGPGGTCYSVPANGQLTLGPEGAGPGITPMPSGTANALMSATVTATGSPVAAAVYAYLSGGSLKGEWYGGFAVKPPASGAARSDDLGTELSIPIALKTAEGYYSQILISNPNPDAATVKIDYASGANTYSVSMTVPANGVASHSVYSDNTVPIGFVGAATVHSDQPLAAVVFRSKMTTTGSYVDEDLYTAMNGVPLSKGATRVYLPYVSRRQALGAGFNGISSWVSVAVVGGGTANLTLTTIASPVNGPTCETSSTFTTTKTVTGSFVFYLNLDQDNGLGGQPRCLVGAMTITSDVPIIAVGDVIDDLFTGDQEAGYNAIRG